MLHNRARLIYMFEIYASITSSVNIFKKLSLSVAVVVPIFTGYVWIGCLYSMYTHRKWYADEVSVAAVCLTTIFRVDLLVHLCFNDTVLHILQYFLWKCACQLIMYASDSLLFLHARKYTESHSYKNSPGSIFYDRIISHRFNHICHAVWIRFKNKENLYTLATNKQQQHSFVAMVRK